MKSFPSALLFAILSAVIAIPLWRSEMPSADIMELGRISGSAALVAFLTGGFWWSALVLGRQSAVRGFFAGALTAASTHLLYLYPGALYYWISGEGSPLDADAMTEMPGALAVLFYGFAGIGTLGGGLSILALALVGMLLGLKKSKPAKR